MKRKFLLLAMVALVSSATFAQSAYNKWSIDAGVGMNKPWRNMTAGYATSTPNFVTFDVGLRWMWSRMLGAKVDFGYNTFNEGDNSRTFDANYMRVNLQLVANAGRVLRFEEWTKTIGLLVHGGAGVGFINNDDYMKEADQHYNLMGGATLQFRLSNRFALNLDGTAIMPIAKDERPFDGVSTTTSKGLLFNGTVGFSIYLGKNEKHADWYLTDTEDLSGVFDRFASLEEKIDAIKNIDPKELAETQENLRQLSNKVDGLGNTTPSNSGGGSSLDYNEFVSQLTKDGFVSVLFAVNSSTVEGTSVTNINFLKSYLENNPNSKVEVRGYADETGSADYNKKLSQRRADTAAKLLVNAGIDKSRISTIGMGVDKTVDARTANGRKFARRATFAVK